jgi:hypothetical protein
LRYLETIGVHITNKIDKDIIKTYKISKTVDILDEEEIYQHEEGKLINTATHLKNNWRLDKHPLGTRSYQKSSIVKRNKYKITRTQICAVTQNNIFRIRIGKFCSPMSLYHVRVLRNWATAHDCPCCGQEIEEQDMAQHIFMECLVSTKVLSLQFNHREISNKKTINMTSSNNCNTMQKILNVYWKYVNTIPLLNLKTNLGWEQTDE